jgi:hypothetical protein
MDPLEQRDHTRVFDPSGWGFGDQRSVPSATEIEDSVIGFSFKPKVGGASLTFLQSVLSDPVLTADAAWRAVERTDYFYYLKPSPARSATSYCALNSMAAQYAR